LIAADASSSSSSSTPSTYVSVRSLDKYGHSEQLQNALKAANMHGTLVVGARDTSKNVTIFLSLLDASALPTSSTAIVSKNPSMLQLINGNPGFGASNGRPVHRTAIVCTGLKGDTNWLVDKVRTYSHRVWNRYDAFIDAPGAAYAVSKYMRRFWKYDEEEEWSPGLLAPDLTGDEQENAWSRPLGICTMIASSFLPYLFVVEPSGVIQRYSAFAMGRGSHDVLEKLGNAIQKDDGSVGKIRRSTDDLQESLIQTIKSSLVGSSKKGKYLLVEVLSNEGVVRDLVPI